MNLIILTILIGLILIYVFKAKKRRDLARKIHGPKCIPLIGFTPLFFVSPEEILPIISKLQSQFKRFYKVWLGPELWVIVYDPKLVEKIVTDQTLTKSNDYEFLKPWLGQGLLTSEGKSWFTKRKAITPAFHFTILESFIEIFENQTEILLEKFNTDEIIDVSPHLFLCAFDIICETSMGFEMNAQKQKTSEYVQAVNNVAEISHKRMFNPLLQPEWIFRFLKDHKILYNSLEVIDRFTQKVINERRKLLVNNIENDNLKNSIQTESNQIKERKALLDTLLTATIDGKPLNDSEIKDEVNTFLFAGHDTTGSTLSFLLYNIAKYSDVQQKIYDEIKTELIENDILPKLSISKLNNLKYLDLVIKESMRYHSTVPFIGKQTNSVYQLDANTFIPNNANLSVYIYGMFHNEDLFPEPEKFIPERFASQYNAEEFNPFSYVPFSAGHRNCIGQKFALLELKTVIVKIIEKYEIFLGCPNDELILLAGMILKSKNGIQLKFKIRSKNY